MNNNAGVTRHNLRSNARSAAGIDAPRLRYKRLAFGVGVAVGSLLVFGIASAAGGIAANTSPTGGKVVGGVGNIEQNGASTIINQQSNLLSLNWDTFNVGKDASVLFNQPGANAVALNRILDQNPSQIFGKISSNGQIFLINTHGIIFGASAQLNVGGLVASTLDLTPNDFLKQHYALDAHGASAGVVNHGTIAAASGGSVTLIGGQVANDGLIVADYGHINLDGADKAVLNFDGDGLINVEITGPLQKRFDAQQAAVSNSGTLKAQSGSVVLEASAAKGLFDDLVNNSGVIDAHGISTAGGVVRLVGSGGNVISSGSIDANGTQGGSVQLLSDQNVGVMGGSIDASGTQGGGSIRVGGGWQGGEGLQTASATYVAPDAALNADATQRGNGGSIVVWGNDVNNFYGSISARGGALGGNGGQVETSSHYGLNAQGSVDASAAHGAAGLWLLDPFDVTIDGTGGTAFSTPFTAVGTSTILNTNVNTALGAGTSVFVFTNTQASNGSAGDGDITVNAPIQASGSGASLYLKAAGSIFLDNTISGASGSNKPLNVYLWANYGGGATDTAYSSNPTCASSTHCQVAMGDTAAAGITAKGGNVDIETTGAFNVGNNATATTSTIDTGGGSLTVNAAGGTNINSKGTLTLSGANAVALGSVADNGVLDVSGLTGGVGVDSLGGASATASVVLGSNSLTIDNALAAIDTSNTFAGIISGNGAVALTGGMQALTGTNTYKGGTTINGGATLQVDADANLGISTGAVSIDNGTLQIAGASFASGRTFNIADTATVDTDGNDATLSGAIKAVDSSHGTFAKAGAGTLKLSANNSIYKNTEIQGGTLALSGTGAALGGKFLTVDNGATFDISNAATGGATVYTLAGTGTVALGSQTLTLGAGGTSWTFGGVIEDGGINSGTGGNIIFSSTGKTGTLTGANTFTGSTTINNGTLALSGSGSIADSSGVDVASGATLDISGTTGADIQALTGAGDVALGSQTLTFAGGNTDWSFGGVLADGGIVAGTGGGIAMDESGTTGTLTGTNTYTGDTTLTAGTLAVSKDANLGNGGGVVLDGGTLESTASFTLNRAVSLTGNGGTLLIDSGKNLTVANAITGTGALTQNGANGTLTLDGDVTTAGATQTYNGTVALGNTNINLTGSTVTLNAVTGGNNNLTVTGNAALDGTLSNVNDLLVTGTTDLGVASINTTGTQEYDGALTLNGGNTTLTGSMVTVNSVAGNGNNLKIAGDAALDGALTNVGNLWVTGNTALGVTDVTTNGTQEYDGALSLSGDTTLTSNSANTGTTVTVHDVNSNVSGNSHNLKIAGNAALDGTFTDVGNLQVTGTTDLGVASVNTTGTQEYDGNLTLNGGNTTLAGTTVTVNGLTGSGNSLSVTGNAALNGTLAGINALSVSGATALGATSITSSGTQTYTGPVTLQGDASVASTGGSVDFDNTVDSASATAQSLDVSATSGDVKFGGAVGATFAVNNLTTNSATLNVASTLKVAGNLAVTTTGGPIAQSAAWKVTGTSNFNAGANAINLGDTDNDFQQAVSLTNTGNNAVSLNNGGNALTLGTLSLGNGALTLTNYGSTPLLLTQSITTDGGAVDFGGAVTIGGGNVGIDTTGGGSVATGANISFGGNVEGQTAGADNLSLNAGNGGTVSFGGNVSDMVALGNLGITAKAMSGIPAVLSVDGDLSIDTVDALTTGSTWSGADVTLKSGGDLTLAGNVTATATAANGTVDLESTGGAISQTSGVITANTLTGQSQGSTSLGDLNAIANLGTFNAGAGFSLTNAGALDVTGAVDSGSGAASINNGGNALTIVGSVTSNGNALTLDSGDLTVNGSVNAGTGTASLNSSGAIGEGIAGVVTAGTLTGSSTGATTLLGNNKVTELGSFDAAGGFSLTNAQALAVAGAVNGGTGAANIATTSGNLTVGASVTGSSVKLDGASGLAINAAVNSGAGNTDLQSGGDITETGGVITADSLTGSSAGATSLGGANLVTDLGNFSANGSFAFTNAQALDVTGAVGSGTGTAMIDTGSNALTIDGSVASNGNALTLDSGDLTVNGSVNAGSGTATLNSAGAINEATTAVITAATLTGGSTNATALNGANMVTALGNFTANGFGFSNAQALDVTGAVDGGAAGTTLTTTAGDLTVDGTVGTAGGDATLDSAGDLVINGTVGNAAGTTTLNSAGAISEGSAGNVVAATLAGSSVGDTTLDSNNNHVATLGTFSAANLSLVDDQSLTVAGPISTTGGTGNISFTTTAGNALNVGQVLTGGSITLDSGSDLTIINAIQGSAVDLSATGNLAINAAVDSGTGTTTLAATGAISETGGSITAGTLTGQSNGATTLSGANMVAKLGGFTAAGFSLSNGTALDVTGNVDGGAAGTSLTTTVGALTIDGTVGATTGDTALTSAGDLTINGTAGNAGSTVTLNSGSAINEGSAGQVIAATLTGNSTGDAVLGGANQVASLGAFEAKDFTLNDTAPLSVDGLVLADGGTLGGRSGDISLTTMGAGNTLTVSAGGTTRGADITLDSAGDLAVNGTVDASGTLALTSAGAISEAAGGLITAAFLNGSSTGPTMLDQANLIGELDAFSADGLDITSAIGAFAVAGTVDGGAAGTTLTSSAGNMVISGTVGDTGGTTTLTAAGGIDASGGAVNADTLTGSAGGAATFTGTNNVAKLGDFTADGFSLTDAQALDATGTVDGGAGGTTLTTTSGDISIDGTVGNTGGTTALNSAGAINQGAAGVVLAGTLTGQSAGTTTLDGANTVLGLGNFTADGLSLTTNSGLTINAGSTVDGGGSTTLTTNGAGNNIEVDGTVKGTTTTLVAGGAISEGSGGVVDAGTLTGSAVGDAAFTGSNLVDSIGQFNAQDFSLTDAQALSVDGPLTTTGSTGDINLTTTGGTANTLTVNQAVQGGAITLASAGDLTVANSVTGTQIALSSNGNLAIDAAVDSGTGTVTLTQAGTGAITGGVNGSITAGTLTGSATGTTTLGTAAQFMDNHVGILGGFSSHAGFSFTNNQTLTLASVNGSAYTVDAGQSNLYLGVQNGDLLETGNTWAYDGTGTWEASGHIGTVAAPIYLIGAGVQTVGQIGLPPAYFYAVDALGNFLPFAGSYSVNVPQTLLSSHSQGNNGHSDRYIDISVITAIYRPYGIMPPGILLPSDQQQCDPDQPSTQCPENN